MIPSQIKGGVRTTTEIAKGLYVAGGTLDGVYRFFPDSPPKFYLEGKEVTAKEYETDQLGKSGVVAMKEVETYWANIYVGTIGGYDGSTYSLETVKEMVSKWANSVPICVTVTPTDYLYKDGSEPGVVIGLINYPRFPKSPTEIRIYALQLAQILKDSLGQHRVSVVMPDKTVMLGSEK